MAVLQTIEAATPLRFQLRTIAASSAAPRRGRLAGPRRGREGGMASTAPNAERAVARSLPRMAVMGKRVRVSPTIAVAIGRERATAVPS